MALGSWMTGNATQRSVQQREGHGQIHTLEKYNHTDQPLIKFNPLASSVFGATEQSILFKFPLS